MKSEEDKKALNTPAPENDHTRRKRKRQEVDLAAEAHIKAEVEALAAAMPEPEKKLYKSIYPADTSDNDRYSASKVQALTGKGPYKTKKIRNAEALILAIKETPPADVLEMPTGKAVIESIEDELLRGRVFGFMTFLLEGGLHKPAMEKYDFNWNQLNRLKNRYPGLTKLWTDCRDLGESFRQIVRADAAHSRAVDGFEEDIYSNAGKKVGVKQVYSDRLLELLLKADDPAKFRPAVNVEGSEGLVLNIKLGIDRKAFKEEAEAKEEKEVVDGDFEVIKDD